MPRPLRPNIAGGVYHVMARGNGKQTIYADDEDRERFMRLLDRSCVRHGWQCFAFCLMDNHYHVVLRTPRPNLSRGMHQLNAGYANAFNRRRQRPGHVFQGRFRSVVIRDPEHLLLTVKYVLRNPVTSGFCETPGQWPWSSFRATAAGRPPDAILGWFGAGENGRKNFAAFIAEDSVAPIDRPPDQDVEFPTEPTGTVARPPLEAVLLTDPGPVGIGRAYRDFGYSLRQIAAVLGRDRHAIGELLVARESTEMLKSTTWPLTK